MKDLRAYNPHARRTRLRGPRSVQIQTVDRCNASCVMCPYSAVAKTGSANSMDDGLYSRILDELSRTGTVKTVILMLQNEPLLDRKFVDRVELARQILGPSVRITTVTNGAPLTTSKIEALAGSGINRVSVSLDSLHADTYAKIRQGLDFQRALGNTLELVKQMGSRRVRIRFLRQRENEGEEKAFAAYWRRKGIPVMFSEVTNRTGLLESYESVRKKRPDFWQKLIYPILNRLVPACPLPFSSLNILVDGRVILCCNDWGPRDSVGNLSVQTLEQVWNGDKINHYRQLLWSHRAAESRVCAGCSIAEHFWSF